MPLAFILIGEMFTLQQRAKMQGLFSGVWGVSSIIGPLLGGFLVDQLSWRWIFYINVLPGLLAAALVALAWRDQHQAHERPAVDYAGAALLTLSVVMLLLGLTFAPDASRATSGWVLIGVALALFVLLVWVERRAADPVLPLTLFRDRLFSTATAHGVLTGWAMFGSVSFIPLFVQAVLGTTATEAGITITPMLLGWVTASIIGTRLLLIIGYRKLGLIGTASLIIGSFLMSQAGMQTSRISLMVFVALMGIGMGLSIPSFLIAVQTSVTRRQLGTATSMLQFSRSMGGTLGVSVMGAALSTRLAANLIAARLDPDLVRQLLDPLTSSGVVIAEEARFAMANAIHLVFVIAFFAAALAMIAVLFTPHKELAEQASERSSSPVSAD
jgi:MFS family permease